MAFPANIDLSSLDGTNGFVVSGSSTGSATGFSVSNAGDLSGDGIDDLAIGATDSGTVYVIIGHAGPFPDPLNVIDPSGQEVWSFSSSPPGQYGHVVGSGDFNGDKVSDLLVGAPEAAATPSGKGFIIFGPSSPSDFPSQVELRAADYSKLGYSISYADDVNDDGIDDLIIAAPGDGSGGASYVVFGSSDPNLESSPFINITDLTADTGFVINGSVNAVGNAGDVNDDEYDDLILGSPDTDTAYIVFGAGGKNITDVDLASLGGHGIELKGPPGSHAGHSVSTVGDINGDDTVDFIVGAPGEGEEPGTAYVVFGNPDLTSFSSIDLSGLDGTSGFIIPGIVDGGRFGQSVSDAGDVNNDGYDDLIIGAPGAGMAYVVFGGPGIGSSGIVDIAALDGASGFSLTGGPTGRAGYSVSYAGDINKDGIDDLVVGAPDLESSTGAAYVIFGGPNSPPTPPAFPPPPPPEPNQAPVASDDHYTAPWNQPLAIAGPGVLANDTDGNGDPLTVTGIVSAPQHGVLAWSADGGFTYTINVEYSGVDGFSYTVDDGHGGRDTATVTIDVTDTDDGIPPRPDVDGGPASEHFWGTNRIDEIRGMGGDDTIEGDGGRDLLNGNGGNDVVDGEGDEDDLHGGQGDDWVLGGAGNDTVHGDLGDDRAWGGRGNDQVFGDGGDDVLHGDRGNDALTGGDGADQFAFGDGSGLDRIADFDQAEDDRIVLEVGPDGLLNGVAFSDFDDIQARLGDGPDGVVLDLGDGNLVTIAGVTKAQLTADDFLVV